MDIDDIEITSISVGYTRKINHKLYGAAEFETSDHPITLNANIRDGQNILTVYDTLSEACQELVNRSVENEITSFAGGLTPDKFYNYIRDFVANRPIDGEVYQQCNQRQKAILQAIKRGKQAQKRDDAKNDNGQQGQWNRKYYPYCYVCGKSLPVPSWKTCQDCDKIPPYKREIT